MELIHLDATGAEIGRLETRTGSDLRLMRLLDDGGFLLGLAGPHCLLRLDREAQLAGRWKLPGKGYLGLIQPGGSILASTGHDVSIVRLDSDGGQKVVAGGKAHSESGLLWFSGFDVLDNGNIVVANWCGHGHAGEGPHLIEFHTDNRIVWKWADHQAAMQVTNVLILDKP